MAFTSFVDTVTNGAGVLPVEISNEIISALPAQSAALTMFRTIPMGTQTEIMPVMAGLATAGFVGEAEAITASNPVWANRQLVAAKIASIVPFAREVLEDTSFDLQANLIPSVVEAIGGAIDGAVLFGVNKPTAWTANSVISGSTAASATTTYAATALVDNINSVMGYVEAAGYDVNGFIAANSMKAKLRGLVDSTGRPIYASMTATEPANLWGEPVAFLRNGGFDTTQGLLIAGDFSKGVIGLRSDIRVDILRESTITSGSDSISLGQNDMVALRFTMRVAYQVANCGTRIGGANAWPFAVLKV